MNKIIYNDDWNVCISKDMSGEMFDVFFFEIMLVKILKGYQWPKILGLHVPHISESSEVIGGDGRCNRSSIIMFDIIDLFWKQDCLVL